MTRMTHYLQNRYLFTVEERNALVLLSQRKNPTVQYWWSFKGNLMEGASCNICGARVNPYARLSITKHGLSHLKESGLKAFI